MIFAVTSSFMRPAKLRATLVGRDLERHEEIPDPTQAEDRSIELPPVA